MKMNSRLHIFIQASAFKAAWIHGFLGFRAPSTAPPSNMTSSPITRMRQTCRHVDLLGPAGFLCLALSTWKVFFTLPCRNIVTWFSLTHYQMPGSHQSIRVTLQNPEPREVTSTQSCHSEFALLLSSHVVSQSYGSLYSKPSLIRLQ
jgi:hypothetical protein